MVLRAGGGIAVRRKGSNLTQSDLSLLSGVTQSTISRLEAGLQSPNMSTLEKLANALNCTIADLTTPPQPSRAELEIRRKLEVARRLKPAPEGVNEGGGKGAH